MEDRTDNKRLRTTKRMIAHKEIFLIGRQMLLATDAIGDIEVIECLVKETHTFVMLYRQDNAVDIILVDAALEEADDEAWQFLAQLRTQHLI